ncbi:hypothetical protein T484DRAFT_1838666 [Baffinella frigidus]|nr:hypothetical protein T484DRAFT_1838666 [Cryptophyta sp. CCMP2293]
MEEERGPGTGVRAGKGKGGGAGREGMGRVIEGLEGLLKELLRGGGVRVEVRVEVRERKEAGFVFDVISTLPEADTPGTGNSDRPASGTDPAGTLEPLVVALERIVGGAFGAKVVGAGAGEDGAPGRWRRGVCARVGALVGAEALRTVMSSAPQEALRFPKYRSEAGPAVEKVRTRLQAMGIDADAGPEGVGGLDMVVAGMETAFLLGRRLSYLQRVRAALLGGAGGASVPDTVDVGEDADTRSAHTGSVIGGSGGASVPDTVEVGEDEDARSAHAGSATRSGTLLSARVTGHADAEANCPR